MMGPPPSDIDSQTLSTWAMAPKSVEGERRQQETRKDLKRHIENEEEGSLVPTRPQYVHPPFPSTPSSLLPPSILPGPKWDKFVSIKEWQEKTSPNVEPGEVDILSRLYKSGLDIFSSLIRTSRKHPELSKDKQEAVEHQFQLFRLWGDDFDTLRGGLDRHLLYSRDLQQTTLSLLISTSEILSQRLIRYMLPSADARRSVWETTNIATLLEEARYSNSENTEFDDEANRSDQSEADFPTDSIDEVLEDLKVGIRCLIDLIPSILWPAEDPEHREKVPKLDFQQERTAHEYYSDLLSKRFPEADPNLIERLGQANWTRYKRGQAEREANIEKETIDINPSGSVYSPSKFHDSGLGSLAPARTTYTQSIVSSGGSKSRIPPLSQNAKKGEPFRCDACGRSIRVKSDREWRY